ncbi:MAG: penicillin-insensitive murein endopeptidase [Nannocystaceae bacterium]|nr:penicillin-insensitive murein endopeptidase [Nannocystaceae bacterium]
MRVGLGAWLAGCLLGACGAAEAEGEPRGDARQPQTESAPEFATAPPSDTATGKAPPGGAGLVGDPLDRELEILDMANAESADDFLLALPGSSGLRADAAADLIPQGGQSIGTPQRGKLSNAIPLPPRPHLYTRRHPGRSFGSTHTIRTIQTAMSTLRFEKGIHTEVMIGDISLPSGGPISPHVSHQSGRDIDIRLLLVEGLDRKTVPVDASSVNWDETWTMVHSFLETGAVKVLFLDFQRQSLLHAAALRAGIHPNVARRWFQWPQRGGPGLIRHEAGHRAHVHIRLGCGHGEPGCQGS